jgi:alpha-glucosidase
VLGNHDVSRIASRVGNAQARVAMMLLLTLRGTPTLYYGDEIGMIDVPIAPDQILDPLQQWAPELGRDPARTPCSGIAARMHSSAYPAPPWLPIAEDYRRVNVAAEREDPRSMLVLTQALIAARRASPALFGGAYRSMDHVPLACLVYVRETKDERRVIALNFSSTDQTVALLNSGEDGSPCRPCSIDASQSTWRSCICVPTKGASSRWRSYNTGPRYDERSAPEDQRD